MIGFDNPITWVIAVLAALAIGGLIGTFQGVIVAYVGVPSFIVTLGGLLGLEGVAWALASGRTIAPMDRIFQVLGEGHGGRRRGVELGGWYRRLRRDRAVSRPRPEATDKVRVPSPPLWADITLGVLGSAAILGAVW